MKSLVRFLALLCVICLCLGAFSACRKDKGTQSGGDGTSSVDVNDVVSTETINYFDADGDFAYRLIYPDAKDEVESKTAVSSIVIAANNNFKVTIKGRTDSQEDDGKPEILVGKTNRDETTKAKALLDSVGVGRLNEYILCTVGNSIVIYGNSDEALKKATEYFINNYFKDKTVSGGIYYTYAEKENYVDYTVSGVARLSKFNIVRPLYNVSYVTQQEIDRLVDKLSTNGGYLLNVINDKVASTDGSATFKKTDVAEYEIIVGNCDRDGVKTITNKDTFEIRIEDKKVFLNGGSPYATAVAVTEFASLLESKKALTSADSVLSGSYKTSIAKYDSAINYKLTWQEDFEGSEINTKTWYVGWGERAYSTSNDKKPAYRGNRDLKNNYVKNGALYIDAIETPDGYYGGLLTTQGSMEYKYGYIEMSTIHPKPEGIWVALYTMSAVGETDKNNVGAIKDPDRLYYNETDIDECYGGGTWTYGNTFAWPTQAGKNVGIEGATHVQNRLASKDDRGFWMDFHTFGYEILDNKQVKYICDGNVWKVQNLREGAEQAAYDASTFLRLGMAAGTSLNPMPTEPNAWAKNNSYVIDYIHIYQHKGNVLYTKDFADTEWKESVLK